MSVPFEKIQAPTPTREGAVEFNTEIHNQLDAAASFEELLDVVNAWDKQRRELLTWENLTHLRFSQDTTNPDYKKALDYCDELRPKLTELDVSVKRKLVSHPRRAELSQEIGEQAIALWEADLLTYDPVIEDDMVHEAKLRSQYNELCASAKFECRGETFNIEGIGKLRVDENREVRYDAESALWGWFADNREQLDEIYAEQVKLRDSMARKLGFDDYIGLAYKQMQRIDYGREDVTAYRDAVRELVVPLCTEIRRQQTERMGLEKLMFWDQSVHDPNGNPKPQGDHDWMLERAQEMFDAMGGGLDDFFRLMVEGNFLDLKNREGKAGGGFCTDFTSYGQPYIFANFNGTQGDVEVFTHEVGHAFQVYSSRDFKVSDYNYPTYEACEIHSMGLEFLTYPQMERFFGDDADRFRSIHLAKSLLFLPYGVAVDHFQHLVYANPSASPAERFEMWQEMERTYLPTYDYGNLPHVSDGGRWQLQRHIYMHPFYYIDYTLAQTCALQFWARSSVDYAAAMRDYVALCCRGGEAPFQELAKSAGLVSPFATGCLDNVVAQARQVLNA